MRLWDMNCPAAVPWRTDAAEVHLRKGLSLQAGKLVAEQMALLPPGQSRTHALTYRAHAATLNLGERRPVLLNAADIFERCGDSLGLAYTLGDLSQVCAALGDRDQARAIAHEAKNLAERCRAASLRGALAAVFGDDEPTGGLSEGFRGAHHLSKAELRVAELAADGATNEQIARKLFITVSTVEQHPTHAYRKLSIRRRTELPSRLREAVLLSQPSSLSMNSKMSSSLASSARTDWFAAVSSPPVLPSAPRLS